MTQSARFFFAFVECSSDEFSRISEIGDDTQSAQFFRVCQMFFDEFSRISEIGDDTI
jgi:hypothetical protein